MQTRVVVNQPNDKKLYSRDGTTKNEFNVRVLDKMTDPSPITRDILPLAVDITDWEDGRMDCK